MNSRFKFPRRVRIHGGECGAVARALHHEAQEDALMSYERASLVPSRFGESPRIDFIERKQMSTKTTLKRIALVAVSALGFGVLTAVAPANAVLTATGISAGTSSPARVGVTSYTTITITHAAMTLAGGHSTTGSTDTFVAAAKVTAVPATSVLRTETNTATKGVTLDVTNMTNHSIGSVTYGLGTASATVTRTTASTSTTGVTSSTFRVGFTADVAGTYTLLVSVGNALYTAGDFSIPLTITTVGAPTALTVASLAGKVVQGGTKGQILSVTMKDANGNATVLADDEGINVTTTDDTIAISNAALAKGEQNTAGAYVFSVTPKLTTTAITSGTAVISFAGTGLLPATLTTNTTVTLRTAGTSATASTANSTLTADVVACNTATDCDGASGTTTWGANVKGATTLKITGVSNATATASNWLVTVNSAPFAAANGTPVGASDALYDDVITVAAGTTAVPTTSTTYAAPAPSTSRTVIIDFGQTTATLTYALPAAKTISVANPVNTILSATGATNTFVAKVVDQYDAAVANVAVTVSVSGRNTVASRTLGVTDANGLISYSLKDAGTTGTRDTITFGMASGTTTSALAYVNYGTVTVSKVTVSGGSKAETVAGSTLTPIDESDDGPDTSAKAIKAVVTDANGNLLAGVPVTFTVDAGAIKKTASVDYSTVYTGTDGAATTLVLGWIAGKQTITATAGGVSSSDYLTWAATDATSARVLSGTVNGNILSYKVVDRFGNPVTGVKITLSRTGSGLFGNGASTQEITTDKTGTADASFNGDATVVAELGATTQAYDKAGEIAATAVTAAVAGTTKGTGASLAPAGVGKVELKVALGADPAAVAANAAADAAAEAIDAANAATDAANLAAEAADAATVAAEEARDAADAATAAVEELATQVATLMAALKAQITTLANTVAKIARKVRA